MSEEQLIKLLEKPLPISVNELCTEGFDFIIPSYQRGYRWTRKEVIRLILDVLSLIIKTKMVNSIVSSRLL